MPSRLDFRCPRCGGEYFGTRNATEPDKDKWIIECHDQHEVRCKWRGTWREWEEQASKVRE